MLFTSIHRKEGPARKARSGMRMTSRRGTGNLRLYSTIRTCTCTPHHRSPQSALLPFHVSTKRGILQNSRAHRDSGIIGIMVGSFQLPSSANILAMPLDHIVSKHWPHLRCSDPPSRTARPRLVVLDSRGSSEYIIAVCSIIFA